MINQAIIDKHDNIALMYSGGKDSTACLYMLKKWWDKIHVIWVNTGAAFPEIVASMEAMKKVLPNFIEVKSNQPDYVKNVGYPTELLPIDYTILGQAIGKKRDLNLSSYIDCCATNIWRPAMDAVRNIRATLIIRGQKNCDEKSSPLRSGQIDQGIEYLFPLQDWSHEQVREYLKTQDFVTPPYYNLLASSLDCWNCTAYCYEHKDKLDYMKATHPQAHDLYLQKLHEIKDAVIAEMKPLLSLVGD